MSGKHRDVALLIRGECCRDNAHRRPRSFESLRRASATSFGMIRWVNDKLVGVVLDFPPCFPEMRFLIDFLSRKSCHSNRRCPDRSIFLAIAPAAPRDPKALSRQAKATCW